MCHRKFKDAVVVVVRQVGNSQTFICNDTEYRVSQDSKIFDLTLLTLRIVDIHGAKTDSRYAWC